MIIKKIPNDRELLKRLENEKLEIDEIAAFIKGNIKVLEKVKHGKAKFKAMDRRILLNLYLFMILEHTKAV